MFFTGRMSQFKIFGVGGKKLGCLEQSQKTLHAPCAPTKRKVKGDDWISLHLSESQIQYVVCFVQLAGKLYPLKPVCTQQEKQNKKEKEEKVIPFRDI